MASITNSSTGRRFEISDETVVPRNVSERQESRLSSLNIEDDGQLAPDGGYGWVCTACVFLINANTWGVNSTFPGGTRFQYSLVGGLSISQALLISPIITVVNRKLGAKVSLYVGTALVSLSLLASSYATTVWHLFLAQGLCFGYGMGFLFVTANAMLPHWFNGHRSLAVGIATSGTGLGGLAYNLIAGHIIQTIGPNGTYRVLALMSVVMNLVAAVFLREYQKDRAVRSITTFKWRHLGRVQFIAVVFWGVATELGYITLLYSLPNYASSIGLSPAQGSVAGALLNLGLGVGRPPTGYLSDTFGRINASMTATFLCAVLCFSLWIAASSYAVLLAFALLAGMVCGTFWSTVVPVLAEVNGTASLASTFGIVCFSLVLPTTFAEPLAMQIVGQSGAGAGTAGTSHYLNTQIFVGCMFLTGALSLWLLRAWRIYNIDGQTGQAVSSSQTFLSGHATVSAWSRSPVRAICRNMLVWRKV